MASLPLAEELDEPPEIGGGTGRAEIVRTAALIDKVRTVVTVPDSNLVAAPDR